MFAILLIIKNFLFSSIKVIFSDWRILAAIGILITGYLIYNWWDNIQTEISDQKDKIVQVERDNKILQDNNDLLSGANKQNALIIEQLTKDSSVSKAQVEKLNNDLKSSNKKIAELKNSIENSKEPTHPLSSYLKNAINGIQTLREQK